jgi:hypothetical protein
MNKLHSKFASVVILAILLFSLNSMGAANNVAPRGPVENYQQFEIYAGQRNTLVGYVEIWNGHQYTYIRFSTIPGWYLMQTNLHLAMNLRDIPQNERGEPMPERFAYQARHNFGNQYIFQIHRVDWRYGAAYVAVTNGSNVPTAFGWAHNGAGGPLPNHQLTWYFENRN